MSHFRMDFAQLKYISSIQFLSSQMLNIYFLKIDAVEGTKMNRAK